MSKYARRLEPASWHNFRAEFVWLARMTKNYTAGEVVALRRCVAGDDVYGIVYQYYNIKAYSRMPVTRVHE